MATSVYLSPKVKSEQLLFEDLIIESMQMYGQDVYYLPRELVNEDDIFGDDSVSKFNKSYKIEMYIENTEGFDGDGDLFTKFGVEIRDEATFIVARRRWNKLVTRDNNDVSFYRPREGDLIYLTLSGSYFEIQKVEDESPFYQLNNLPTFKIRASLFEYNDEDFNTGIEEVNRIEESSAYRYVLNITQDSAGSTAFAIGEYVQQAIDSDAGIYVKGNVVEFNDSDSILYIAHVGSTDGQFREFVDSGTVTGLTTNAEGIVTAVSEDNTISENEQNDAFATEVADFLDFSESNPFGDPE